MLHCGSSQGGDLEQSDVSLDHARSDRHRDIRFASYLQFRRLGSRAPEYGDPRLGSFRPSQQALGFHDALVLNIYPVYGNHVVPRPETCLLGRSIPLGGNHVNEVCSLGKRYAYSRHARRLTLFERRQLFLGEKSAVRIQGFDQSAHCPVLDFLQVRRFDIVVVYLSESINEN